MFDTRNYKCVLIKTTIQVRLTTKENLKRFWNLEKCITQNNYYLFIYILIRKVIKKHIYNKYLALHIWIYFGLDYIILVSHGKLWGEKL